MLIILAGAFVVLGSMFMVSAYRGDNSEFGPNYSEDRHETMEDAFESGDYQTWKDNHPNQNARVLEVITEENFDKFSEVHELMEEGNYEQAQIAREELGLGMKNHNGEGRNSHSGNNQRQGGCSFK